jgi:two-component system, chemotaxis family, protein-glutamate methylesterase/glutaminase
LPSSSGRSLFRSAGAAYRARAIGVILTGALNDGTAGLYMIKQRGGTAIVQDPSDATEPSMPLSALRNVQVDHRVPLDRIAPLLVRLTQELIPTISEMEAAAVPRELDIEIKIAQGHHAREVGVTQLGEPSLFTCPECHGTLLKLRDEHPLRFRCHTGHAFTADSLLSGNYSPIGTRNQWVAGSYRPVRASRIAARGLRPCRRPVETMEQRSA